MEVTKFEELKQISKGEVVCLPGFSDKPFVCRLKRPSLLDLVASGEIPNPLIATAYKVFYAEDISRDEKDKIKFMKENSQILKIVAQRSLVEPTYNELCEIGLDLTDMQLIAIFNYTQQGVRVLEPFREIQGSSEDA